MNEEAKVCHTNEAIKKIEVREKNGSVKFGNLKSNNRDIEILSMHSCSVALSFIFFSKFGQPL